MQKKSAKGNVPWHVIEDLDMDVDNEIERRHGACNEIHFLFRQSENLDGFCYSSSTSQIPCFHRCGRADSSYQILWNLCYEDKKTRDKAIKQLAESLSSQDALSKSDLAKLWKGIFYCAIFSQSLVDISLIYLDRLLDVR